MKKETARGIYELMETGKWLAVGAFIYFLLTGYVFGSAICLTKHEARKLWPTRHLYWYSGNHCWSNRRGGPPTGVKYDLIRDNHAESLPSAKQQTSEVIFPQVKQVIPWVDPKLYEPKAATLSHRLLDIDELTSRNHVPDPLDQCCWPELVPDGKGSWRLKE